MTSSAAAHRKSLRHIAAVIKCLGHPMRLQILEALEEGEKTVSELQDRTGAHQATVSRHLATLRGRHVVASRRDGVNVYYRVVEPHVHTILDCIRDCGPDT